MNRAQAMLIAAALAIAIATQQNELLANSAFARSTSRSLF